MKSIFIVTSYKFHFDNIIELYNSFNNYLFIFLFLTCIILILISLIYSHLKQLTLYNILVKILITEPYIKHGEKTQGKRKIYEKVTYDKYETEKI